MSSLVLQVPQDATPSLFAPQRLKPSSGMETMADCAGWAWAPPNDQVYRNAIETARADHRAGRALVWEGVALAHQLAALGGSATRRLRFLPIDRLLWAFMSWWWPGLARRPKVIQPETVLRWRRHGIALIWNYGLRGRWRGGRPRILLVTRQLIREMARVNFFWGAPRIHGELRKHGITVSLGHNIAIYASVAKSPSLAGVADIYEESRDHDCPKLEFHGNNWARDLLSRVRSRSARLHESPFSICRCTGYWPLVLGCLAYSPSTPCCYSSSAYSVYQNCNSDYQIHSAGVSIPAGGSRGRLLDRIRAPSTAQELKRYADPLINAVSDSCSSTPCIGTVLPVPVRLFSTAFSR